MDRSNFMGNAMNFDKLVRECFTEIEEAMILREWSRVDLVRDKLRDAIGYIDDANIAEKAMSEQSQRNPLRVGVPIVTIQPLASGWYA